MVFPLARSLALNVFVLNRRNKLAFIRNNIQSNKYNIKAFLIGFLIANTIRKATNRKLPRMELEQINFDYNIKA